MEPHAQAVRLAQRASKQSRLHALEAKTRTPTQGMVLKHGGVTDAVTEHAPGDTVVNSPFAAKKVIAGAKRWLMSRRACQ